MSGSWTIKDPEPKKCHMCGEVKPPEAYWADRNKPDGLQDACIECLKEYEPRQAARLRYEHKRVRKRVNGVLTTVRID